MRWPGEIVELDRLQRELASMEPGPWSPPAQPVVGGVFVCFERSASGPGAERGWAGSASCRAGILVAGHAVAGRSAGPYRPGYLALREGPLLEAAVRGLGLGPEVLLVNATGRDHPRRAGLALHLGAVLGLPTVGVTHRPLEARGAWPGPERGRSSPVTLDGEVVGAWLRTRTGARPLVVHPGWRTDFETAVRVVMLATERVRTPLPVREARRLARVTRAVAEGRAPPPC